MVNSCSAIDCKNRHGTPGVSFYRFPSDPKMRNKWIAACRRKDWIPGPYSRLCSNHFVTRKRDLNHYHDFVPTIFTFNPSPKKQRKKDDAQNDDVQKLATTGILPKDIKKIQECDSADEFATKILLRESEALRDEIAKLDFRTVDDSGTVLGKSKDAQ